MKRQLLEMKNAECKLCGKLFQRNSNLNNHLEMVHHGLTRNPCDLCGKSVVDLPRHMMQISCNLCENIFCSKSSLARHLKEMHLRSKK